MKRIISFALFVCMLASVIVIAPDKMVSVKASAAVTSTGASCSAATFILDPGHGGSDPGAMNGSREEADDVLRLSIRIAQIITASGESCALTRATDVTHSLSEKASIANAGSFTYFLSVHRNAGGGVGIETYYYSGASSTSTGARLATSVQNAMVNSGVWTKNRGVKSANYAVLRNTTMAAALVEVGFIDSSTDNSIFDAHFETIAVSIANGLLAMVGKSVTSTSSSKYQSCLDSPSGGGKTNGAISTSASVTQNGSGDNLSVAGWTLHSDGISSVRYKIDSGSYVNLSTSTRSDVQNAISGYSDYSNCGFSGTISYAKLSGGSHTITIQAVTKKNATYTVATISLSVTDPIAPTISNVVISNQSTSGYRVSCTVSDNAGVTSVRFPTWTSGNGQDDLVWHEGTISGSTAYYDVKISEHGNYYDVYNTHIYAYDAAGNSSSYGGPSVNLNKDTTPPTITDYKITNVNYWGFDITCKISDNIGATKIQFPTWTESGGQDDIQWYTLTPSGNTYTYHVNTATHGYQTGSYNVHLYAWDLWNNETCAEMSVNVPTPEYPTDADYIPLTTVNGGQNTSSSQIMTTGTLTGQYWGALVLAPDTNGYKVTAKYLSGDTKSVTASASNPVIAVHSGVSDAYAALASAEVGDIVSLEGVNVSAGVVLTKAHLKLPVKFALTESSPFGLDDQYVTANGSKKTAADIAKQFVCTVSVYTADGALLADSTVGGTGCVVKYINSNGTVVDSAILVVLGDIDGDGIVSSVDLISAKSVMKKSITVGGAYEKALDADCDNSVSSIDYMLIKKML